MIELENFNKKVCVCTDCSLSKTRNMAVPGEGSYTAEVMFVGEGPGSREDKQGRPFVGPAGKILDELLELVGMDRSKVYITNIVKCRPPNNRDPLPEEVEACSKYLDIQLKLVNPSIVVTLGRHSLRTFFPQEIISKSHGKPRKWNNLLIYPLYHPAAILHQGGGLRKIMEADFKQIPYILESCRNDASGKIQSEENNTEQLKLFDD